DEDGDFFVAIRRCKSKSVLASQPTTKPILSVPAGVLAAHPPSNPAGNGLPELLSPDDSADNGTKPGTISQGLFGVKSSGFLTGYDYTGHKRHNLKAGEPNTLQGSDKTTLQHSRKRPSPEVIDLTDLPDNPNSPGNGVVPSSRKTKRRRLDEQGREKRHRSQRAHSQAHDDSRDARKRLSSEKRKAKHLFGDRGKSVPRSSASRKSKESSRRRHLQGLHKDDRHREKERAKPRDQQVSGEDARQEATRGVKQTPHGQDLISRQQPRSQLLQTLSQQQSSLSTQAGHHNKVNTTGPNKEPVNTKKGQQTQSNGGDLPATNQDDVDLFRTYASKVPEKRTAQVVSGLPNSGNRNLERNRASQRSEPPAPPQLLNRPSQLNPAPVPNRPANQPYQPPGPAGGRKHQTSSLGQSRNVFQPKPSQSRSNRQSRANLLSDQAIVPPDPPLFSQPSLNYRRPRAAAYYPLHHFQQRQQQQRSFHDDFPQQPVPPRESVSAVEALGSDRTVIQYVVYRTPRFTTPSGSDDEDAEQLLQQVKSTKAVRCSQHFSLQAANSQAAAHQDRLQKGVVGKSWSMVRPLHSSINTTTNTSSSTSSTPSLPTSTAPTQPQTQPPN
ncbi:uncharacterized protein B0H64DRAFT_296666, partial [Chaetomium fimeti]